MQSSRLIAIYIFFLALPFPPTAASPPPYPVHCIKTTSDCTVTNGYGAFPDRLMCHASQVVYPSSKDELLRIMGKVTASKKKIDESCHEILSQHSQTDTSWWVRWDPNQHTVVSLDMKTMRITVESGMNLKDLIRAASKANLAL